MNSNFSHQTSFTIMPKDTNMYAPMVFGGRMLEKMDIAAAECVRLFLMGAEHQLYPVTVNVKDVTFFVGAKQGDLILFNCEIVTIGIKSLVVKVTGDRVSFGSPTEKICEGIFTFVTKENPHSTVGVAHNMRNK